VQLSLAHLEPVGEPEAPLEASRRDAPVKIITDPLFQLLAADDQLAVLESDRKLIDTEASDGERDAKHVSCAVPLHQDLNVVGRVASLGRSDEVGKRTVGSGATKPDLPLKERHTRHSAKPFHSKRLRHVVALFRPLRRPSKTQGSTRRGAEPLNQLAYGENRERIQEWRLPQPVTKGDRSRCTTLSRGRGLTLDPHRKLRMFWCHAMVCRFENWR